MEKKKAEKEIATKKKTHRSNQFDLDGEKDAAHRLPFGNEKCLEKESRHLQRERESRHLQRE